MINDPFLFPRTWHQYMYQLTKKTTCDKWSSKPLLVISIYLRRTQNTTKPTENIELPKYQSYIHSQTIITKCTPWARHSWWMVPYTLLISWPIFTIEAHPSDVMPAHFLPGLQFKGFHALHQHVADLFRSEAAGYPRKAEIPALLADWHTDVQITSFNLNTVHCHQRGRSLFWNFFCW